MFSTLLFWGAISTVLLIVATLVVLGAIVLRREHRRNHHRPIICVCEVNGRVGVVLRRDYDRASSRYWKPYYDAEKHYDAGHIVAPYGLRLEVSPVFVFEMRSQEYYTLVHGCYVERATFDVPLVPKNELNPMTDAHQYFHGEPWSGDLINW